MQKDKNVPLQSRKNCLTILGLDPNLCGKIKFNTLSNRKNVEGGLPWNKDKKLREWTNIDTEYLIFYMETYYLINSDKKILSALEMIADTNKFNPFIDMLNSTKWDKVPRIENLLHNYLGAEQNKYTKECMLLLMLGVISRAFCPGTKFDYVIVITGQQGIGKSTFFRKLCCNDDWYLENLKSIYDEKKAAEKIQGKLIVEFNELMGMKGSIESVKAFSTATADDYRGAYARESEKRKRTCVFVGTTNEAQFLNDKTGNRRFLPIECGVMPIEKSLFVDENILMNEFKQAWAEAYEIYNSGKFSLVLSKEMQEYVEELQADFEEDDPMIGMIQQWLDNCNEEYVCNLMISNEVFNVENPDRKFLNSITSIMENSINGWERDGTHRFTAPGKKYGKQKCYIKSKDFSRCFDDEIPFD